MPFRIAILALSVAFSAVLTETCLARMSEHETVQQASAVLSQIMAAPAQGIPRQLLSDAQAVVIVPRMKGGAFVVGIRKGRGVLVVREPNGWRAPQFVEMTGGSVGWQAGIQSSDVILVFRSRQSLDNLMNGKLTIGADASVAAGPVGRQVAAATDLDMSAEIYSYSRSRGAFVGVSIDGTVLKSDPMADAHYYPQQGGLPQSATQLISQLASYVNGGQGSAGVPVDETSLVLPNPPEVLPDSSHQQLIQDYNQLLLLLDPSWKAYLALPKSAYQAAPLSEVQIVELISCLRRYETIASQPQYAQLASRREFQQVMSGLRNIVSQPHQPELVLPPPPAGRETQQLQFPR